jgi:hypothetical protein
MITGDFLLAMLKAGDTKAAYSILEPALRHVDQLLPPKHHQSVGVTFSAPKTAALCFDRVWSGLDASTPLEIGYWGGSTREATLLMGIATLVERSQQDGNVVLPPHQPMTLVLGADVAKGRQELAGVCRLVAEDIQTTAKLASVPMYDSARSRDTEYTTGDRAAIVAVLEHLPVVNEAELDWQQVIELRRDADAIGKFRRLAHWLDSTMMGKSRAFIEDEIMRRIEDYKATLKGYGLSTVLGSLAATLDSKVLVPGALAGLAGSIVHEPAWGLAASVTLIASRVAVHVGEKLLAYQELKRGTEIAFVTEILEQRQPA